MNYQSYVIAAYVIFVLAILWDWIAPKLQIARARREAKLRLRRDAARKGETAR
ncbi:heme exporter protein CcmD [Solilutibacter silvestris]|uniref:Heme exporter protein D n=1 Tax=Solilutibacter silvestris TaxID=1645665 RepID=A0A2K1PZM5_9GAMM|nr:heme exporter protein CcmD [Lysobacter silvestris]PNS08233.1 Heme exporter protein D (CcmD) [Lysobacter silvestris]